MILVNSTGCSLNVKFLLSNKMAGLADVKNVFEGIFKGHFERGIQIFLAKKLLKIDIRHDEAVGSGIGQTR
jgi:hypothetical protein